MSIDNDHALVVVADTLTAEVVARPLERCTVGRDAMDARQVADIGYIGLAVLGQLGGGIRDVELRLLLRHKCVGIVVAAPVQIVGIDVAIDICQSGAFVE